MAIEIPTLLAEAFPLCFSALYCHSLRGFGCSRFVLVETTKTKREQPKERREWQYNAEKHKGKASASRVRNNLAHSKAICFLPQYKHNQINHAISLLVENKYVQIYKTSRFPALFSAVLNVRLSWQKLKSSDGDGLS